MDRANCLCKPVDMQVFESLVFPVPVNPRGPCQKCCHWSVGSLGWQIALYIPDLSLIYTCVSYHAYTRQKLKRHLDSNSIQFLYLANQIKRYTYTRGKPKSPLQILKLHLYLTGYPCQEKKSGRCET